MSARIAGRSLTPSKVPGASSARTAPINGWSDRKTPKENKMPRSKSSNIRPEHINSVFFDGKDYYTLEACQSEPTATMTRLYDKDNPITKPVSEFKDFIMVKPVGVIKRKQEPSLKERKPRSRKENPTVKENLTVESPNTEEVYIHTPAADETKYLVRILDYVGESETLLMSMKLAVLDCPNQKVPDTLSKKSKDFIKGILEA